MSTKKLSDSLSYQILLDPVDFKLIMAQYYLNKINSSVSLNYDWEHFRLESNSESFLSYSDMVIEMISNNIASEFDLFEDTEDVSIYKIRKSLYKSNLRERLVLNVLDDYFLYPTMDLSGWDLTNSHLWEIRELRNHVAHNRMLNRINYRGGRPDGADYLFRFNWVKKDENTGIKQMMKIELPVANPQLHFQILFEDLMKFVERIRKIIPYRYQSYEHRNKPDFEL